MRKAKRLSYRVVVALAPDVLLRASYPLERITSCQMIHHLRHHTSPSLSFQKAKSSLESPRFLAVKHLDLSLMRDACASWTGILCLQLLYVHTLQYNTYSLLKNVCMNFPSSFKQDSSVGKDQRLIKIDSTINTHPRGKNWIPLESGQTKSVELFCDHSSRRLRSSPRAHRYCKITAGGSITMSSSCSAVPTHSPFRSERSDSLGTTRDLRQGGRKGVGEKGGGGNKIRFSTP